MSAESIAQARRAKARLRISLGYRTNTPEILESDYEIEGPVATPSKKSVYSVEFFDVIGNTVAVVTVPASALRLPTPMDRPAVRALSA